MVLDFPDTNDFTILRKLNKRHVFQILTNLKDTTTLYFREECDWCYKAELTQPEIFQLAEELKLVAQTMQPPNYDFEEDVF